MRIRTFTAGSFAENGYLVACDDGKTGLVVDPGAAASEMLDAIREDELSVAAILLTHSHLDHVEGVNPVLEEWDVPLYLHPDDRPLYDHVAEQAHRFGVEMEKPPPPDQDLEHGQVLEFGGTSFEVRHCPGHAPGHVIFWEKEAGVALVGDVVFRGSIGRTDLPGGNFKQLMSSIREQVLSLPDDTRLLPGHGPETTVRDERQGNPFLIPHYGGELA
ncbi:MAG: MBL fold metallo-hydrolase [Longimicrobiales bacterium]|nr:MBL fold metallo-hydrolase [Longimicrobiales bacterium]